jgi:hypothetical protein
MCTIDWNAVAAWVTAGATVGLLIVAIVAAVYAKGATDSAIQMLRLEGEPVLAVAIAQRNVAADQCLSLHSGPGNRIVFHPETPGTLPMNRTVFISIANVGRSPAINIKLDLVAEDTSSSQKASLALVIQGLSPQGFFTIALHNGTTHAMKVTLANATRTAFSKNSETVDAYLFTSAAFPLTI